MIKKKKELRVCDKKFTLHAKEQKYEKSARFLLHVLQHEMPR
jgi:hypothetical protein